MTTRQFDDYGHLASSLAFDLIDAIKAADWGVLTVSAQYGASGKSASCYANVTVYDEYDDHIGDFKVRFSDHADLYGSDITLRIEGRLIEDDEDTIIENSEYKALVDEAMQALKEAIA